MKKTFKSYVIAWAILLVLFNVVAFLFGGIESPAHYSASFWVGYMFITLAFIGQLVCAHVAFKAENRQKMFYNISLIVVNAIGLVLTLVFSAVCMAVPFLPYWVGVVVCLLVLGFTAIAVLFAKSSADAVSTIDEKVKKQTVFLKSLTVETETLLEKAKSDSIRMELKRIYDAIRYSDPMSSDALSAMEAQIVLKFDALSKAVEEDRVETVSSLVQELLVLVNDRNNKCKFLK